MVDVLQKAGDDRSVLPSGILASEELMAERREEFRREQDELEGNP